MCWGCQQQKGGKESTELSLALMSAQFLNSSPHPQRVQPGRNQFLLRQWHPNYLLFKRVYLDAFMLILILNVVFCEVMRLI